MSAFQLKRIGVLMVPEPGNPHEIEGVLNPGAARGRDGHLYLFPRLVGRGNHSRIGIARVRFNAAGDPVGVDRLGIALEPQEPFEMRKDGTGGCEDPRVTFVEPLDRYVMAYTAFSSEGPRIALAISDDLFRWERLGLATFQDYRGISFEGVDNKDASVLPVAIPDPSGQLSMAILQRRCFPAPGLRRSWASPVPGASITITRASGFRIARQTWRHARRSICAISDDIIDLPGRSPTGSSSRSVAERRPY